MSQDHDRKLETGSHPRAMADVAGWHFVGLTAGTVAGAVGGAVIGAAVAGPIGAVVGGALCAFTGALFGLTAAETLRPTMEDVPWMRTRGGSCCGYPGTSPRPQEAPRVTLFKGDQMKKIMLMALVAVIFGAVAMAGHQVAVLDGTSWKLEVEPDSMTKDKGEKEFKETLTFADGSISLSTPKVGFEASPYTTTKSGEKDYTFKAERTSSGEGSSVWTGVVHGKKLEGKLIWTKNDGSVLTYTFKGSQLD